MHSTYAEAKEFHNEYTGISLFGHDKKVETADLLRGTRNLIVGEPGVGKTELLKRIKGHLESSRIKVELLSLRQPDVVTKIDAFLRRTGKKALLLDGLDEVQASRFPEVLAKLRAVSASEARLPIYLTSRWVFISKHALSFPEFRFISISPFTRRQVREYLLAAGHSQSDVDVLWQRVLSFSHETLVIQIPRYLCFLEDFLTKEGLEAASSVSRNELFEYFIYSKLGIEDQRLNADKRELIKRVLEKLALTMEIYQSNVLTKDELMTFFDEIKSDLKLVAMAQVNLEIFYEKSLLKNNIDTIEFDNTEFQEYLAAKEITRFPAPSLTAFRFAADQTANEIYPAWFNALTFLVDMRPELLEQLVEFSGLRATLFKVVDDSFLSFLSRVNPTVMPVDVRRRLFRDVLEYHRRTRQWIRADLSFALAGMFDGQLEDFVKQAATVARAAGDTPRSIGLANVAYIIGHALEQGHQVDRAFWRARFVEDASDANGVVQRHALFALEELRDRTVLDELPNMVGSEELVARAFLSLCTVVDPDHPKCLDYFTQAITAGLFEGCYGIFALKEKESFKRFFGKLASDESFRRQFIEHSGLIDEGYDEFIERLAAKLDKELLTLCERALIEALDYRDGHEAERSGFLIALARMLRRRTPGFVTRMVRRIGAASSPRIGFHFGTRLFAEVLERQDVRSYMREMLKLREEWAAFDTMVRVKSSGRANADVVFQEGRRYLPAKYKAYDKQSGNAKGRTAAEHEKLRTRFLAQLEPEKDKFSHGVFRFYRENRDRLPALLSAKERDRLRKLLTETVLKRADPASWDLTITEQQGGSTSYTTSSWVRLVGDGLRVAEDLKVDLAPYRSKIISFIPFAYGDELKVIFKVFPDIKQPEMHEVLEVYRVKKSDLWRHLPANLVDAVAQYHISDALPVLKQFVNDATIERSARRKALTVIESLSGDHDFVRQVFNRYRLSTDPNGISLMDEANGILIRAGDAEAIRWRMDGVKARVTGFIRRRGVHAVTPAEEELHGKSFAMPLMELKRPGYEAQFLSLIDEAMVVWNRGEEFHAYAAYLWDIVYAYFDNLKEVRSYSPLRVLERKIVEVKDRDGGNWLASRMAKLRQSYLSYVGRPGNVSAALNIHNDARSFDERKIANSADLFRHLQDVLDQDLSRWIEGEGAYDLIRGQKVFRSKKQEYEKLVQKTIKAQLEILLLRRGFQIEIIREPQLYDEKRTDLLVRYGFVGPIVVEVKLTSNSDLRTSKTRIRRSSSFLSMRRYMEGYGASHGVFLIIDNANARNLAEIRTAYQEIPNVWVRSFECNPISSPPKKNRSRVVGKRRRHAKTK